MKRQRNANEYRHFVHSKEVSFHFVSSRSSLSSSSSSSEATTHTQRQDPQDFIYINIRILWLWLTVAAAVPDVVGAEEKSLALNWSNKS